MSERRRRSAIAATVLRTERLSSSLVRLVIGGDGLRAFQPSPYADSYVKVVFVPPDAPRPLPRAVDGRVDIDELNDALASERRPRMRSYTVRAFDPETRELTLDFVVHGDEGIAGPWAAGAVPGDEILLMGPGGAYSPDPAADYLLLIGDTSVLPAITVVLERMDAGSRGHVIAEVYDAGDEIALTTPPGFDVTWVHQGKSTSGSKLVETVVSLPWPAGDVYAFVHGEASMVKELRRYFRLDRQMPIERLSVSGYWRLGANDEAWRASKRLWNAAIEQSEAAAVMP